MKLLHVEISGCRECPYCGGAWRPKSSGAQGMAYICEYLKHAPEVPDEGVPEWCPLPEKEEKCGPSGS